MALPIDEDLEETMDQGVDAEENLSQSDAFDSEPMGPEGVGGENPGLGEGGEPLSEADKLGLKQGYGRDEFAKTVNNSNYYKEQGEALRKRQEEAERERNNRFKNKDKNPDESNNTGENNNLSKSERDEQGKSATPAGEEKSRKEKAQDRKNVREAKTATVRNKIDSVKAKAYQVRHPVEAAKAKAKEKAKKKVKSILIKYWWVVGIAILLFLLIGMLMLVILAATADEDSGGVDSYKYLAEEDDFTTTLVSVTTSDGVTYDSKLTLDELVMGSVYYATMDKTEGLSNKDTRELYDAYSIIFRTEALTLGGYNNKDKEITIKSGDDFPYCDVYNGCLKIKNGDKISYISAAMDQGIRDSIGGEVIAEYPPLDEEKLSLLEYATEQSTYKLLTPDDYDELMKEADFDNPEFNPEIEEKILKVVKEKDYSGTSILNEVYEPDFKVYNIQEYATEYTIMSDSDSYWFPIGSANPTNGNIYGGDPSVAYVTSKFGGRYINGIYSDHKGVDLSGTAGVTVVIATKSGTVKTVSEGCPNNNGSTYATEAGKCGSGYGNYILIDHGDGMESLYAHLTPNSLTVKSGEHVNQGQKIAFVGSSGNVTGPHLHFEIRENGNRVDPLKYISVENPRPVSTLNFNGNTVQGDNNKQTVCLTLKANGLSDNANAAILSNMASESSFRTNGTGGDGGTSDGLCQWHNGRLSRLKASDHCGSRWTEVGCQIEYLFWELQNEETSTYNEILSDHSAYDIAAYFCVHFERPANKDNCYSVRGENAKNTYLPYVKNGCKD